MLFHSLDFHHAHFSYHADHPLLSDITCSLPMGQAVWIQAPPSSGRSTLLKIMAFLLEPTEGDYLVNGQSTREMSFEETVPFRLKIGYGFDSGGLLHNRSLRDNLLLPILYHNVWSQNEAEARVHHLLKLFDLQNHVKSLPSAVSGGQRKIVTLIRALILEPEIVLLDEPTLGLNPRAQETLLQEIARLRKEGSLKHVFLVSADSVFARKLADCEMSFERHQLSGPMEVSA